MVIIVLLVQVVMGLGVIMDIVDMMDSGPQLEGTKKTPPSLVG
jgi:hypothetical protein